MSVFNKRSSGRKTLIFLIIISLLTTLALTYYNRFLGFLALPFFLTGFLIMVRARKIRIKDTDEYFDQLAARLHNISQLALFELPIGVILYNDELEVIWINEYVKSKFTGDITAGTNLNAFSENLVSYILQQTNDPYVKLYDKTYLIGHKKSERLIYLTNVTEYMELEKIYYAEKTVICILFLDNFDDCAQGLDDQESIQLQNLCASEILDWGREHDFLIRRMSSDKYIGILNEQILERLEKTKFNILDDIREVTAKQGSPLTMSIGVGSGADSLTELSNIAQSSLDLALGRGGDQAVIKMVSGKTRFYGGKSNPFGKRTRVRARVISHAMRDLIVDSDHVIIMGHKSPDMDVYGSSLGLLRMVEANGQKGFIVTDPKNSGGTLRNLFQLIEEQEGLLDSFITPAKAEDFLTENTLLVIVDTHRPSMVIDEKLLKLANKVVVIDHHRRGEEAIENQILSYMEPYASSTSELVTELIEYHPNIRKLEKFAATALLAGIFVDTKSFMLRTGARTFDAASFLRMQGADLGQVQHIFKEEVDTYIARNKLIENVYFYSDGIAIVKANEDTFYTQVQVAKTADTLLTLYNVEASFVIARKEEGVVVISARSLGEINVQLIMESLGGGGHLTNAATQFHNQTLDYAELRLKSTLDEYLEGRNDK